MANYQSNKKSQQGVYGKLKNTVFISPFRKSHHPLQEPTYNNPAENYGPTSGQYISNYAHQKPATKPHESYNKKLRKMLTTKRKSAAKVDKKLDDGVSNDNHEDQFSEYINRVKGGMRTASDVGIQTVPTKQKVSRRDSLNDKVSNFLSRAGIKMRTSSSVGDMQGISIKGKGSYYK